MHKKFCYAPPAIPKSAQSEVFVMNRPTYSTRQTCFEQNTDTRLGLVSVSFRKHSVQEIIDAAAECGLECIEWGSDKHAPCNDIDALRAIADAQMAAGLRCCSYGTYFKLGETPLDTLPQYISAARILGTDTLRLWCGTKSTDLYSAEDAARLIDQCRQAALIAEQAGVKLCLECHRNTYTETKEGALRLMEAVNSAAFRMYWQPNQGRSIEENVEYAALLAPYIEHIHVFQWKGAERFPLAQGIDEWRSYLKAIGGEHTLLLEFMPDDLIATLKSETQALRQIAGR